MKQRNIIVTLQCFVKKDGKYLMLHRNPDKRIMPDVWMAPGGKREFNEGLFACAHREIMEETGLKIKNLRIRATGNGYLKDLDTELYWHFIEADYASGTVHEKPEDGELVWVSIDEMGKLKNLLAEIKKILPILFTSKHPISYSVVYEKGNEMTKFKLENPK